MGYKEYNELGYVPSDIGQSAARTLEYAYNDWCIYQMGKKLGRPASELDIYKKRSQNYKNLFYAPDVYKRQLLKTVHWQNHSATQLPVPIQ